MAPPSHLAPILHLRFDDMVRPVHAAPILIAAATACGPSPQPLPPPFELNVQAIVAEPADAGLVILRGSPGAANSATALEVARVGVASGEVPRFEVVSVAGDGSFELTLPGAVADQFRLQAVRGEDRTDPVDLVGDPADGSLLAAPRVDCVVTTPAEEIVLEGPVGTDPSASLVVDNQCTTGVLINSADVPPMGPWNITVTGGFPADVNVGGAETITVTLFNDIAFEDTAFVVLELTGAGDEQRVITLRGTSF